MNIPIEPPHCKTKYLKNAKPMTYCLNNFTYPTELLKDYCKEYGNKYKIDYIECMFYIGED